MNKLKEMPNDFLPRERLLKYGKESLADYEILAILLRTGTKGLNVLELSKYILTNKINMKDFANISINELKNIKGIKEAKAIELVAAIEFGKRALNYIDNKFKVNNQKDAYLYLKNKLEDKDEEEVIALYLNVKSEIIFEKVISIGSTSETSFDINKIIKYAIKNSSNHIIISHNHPTGDPMPSKQDLLITSNLVELANKFDIKIIDHIIIGKNKYFSFAENRINLKNI